MRMWCFHPFFPLHKCIFSPLHDMLSLRQSCSTACVYMYSSLCECGPAKPSKHNRVFCPDNVYRTLLHSVLFCLSCHNCKTWVTCVPISFSITRHCYNVLSVCLCIRVARRTLGRDASQEKILHCVL